jgi:hypothetical protein
MAGAHSYVQIQPSLISTFGRRWHTEITLPKLPVGHICSEEKSMQSTHIAEFPPPPRRRSRVRWKPDASARAVCGRI